MIDPVLLLIYVFVFPGFFFLFAYALMFEFLDRRIACLLYTSDAADE